MGRNGKYEATPVSIYLDNHATTPVDPRVLEAMLPYLTGKFGNAASRSHQFGWDADAAVESARRQIANLIGASPGEIVFTSGATESDNLAIKGVTEAYRDQGGHIITCVSEHRAVLYTCKHLGEVRLGAKVTYLGVGADGLIDLDALRQAFTPKTVLVSIMAANNETGVLQPVEEIGRLCREHGVLFHSDAVQALGRVTLDVNRMNLDLASLTAHKCYGPKGCGALYVRANTRLAPMIDGGGHERGMRSGTLNVPGIAGFGKACEIALQELPEEGSRIARLRNRLHDRLLAELDSLLINGSMQNRLPGNLNMSFLHVDGEELMTGLKDIAVSSGAACHSDRIEASHVLKAMGRSDDEAASAIRFGIGRFNTEAEIDYVAGRVVEVVKSLRELKQDRVI
jgi:cysteine desulfurase